VSAKAKEHKLSSAPSVVQTEIGTIAPDWKISTLEELCEHPQYGYTASAEGTGNARFLRITDITDSGVKWATVPFCKCPEDLLERYLLKSGDIVFARIGATTGKSYLITNPPRSVFASYLIRVRCKTDIDPDFLSKFFRSDAYWLQVDSQKDTNLKKGVNGSVLKTLQVPVPPLAEQRKIAGVLGLVQRAMEQQERLITLTTELKKALLHQLFTQGLRGEPQKQTEIGPVPQSWELIQFEEFTHLQRGFDLPKSEFREGPYPVIGATTTIGYHDKYNVKGPGVTVVRSGSSAGKPQFIPNDFWAHNVVLFVKDFHGHNPRFAYYKIQELDLTKYREGAAVPTLNRNSFRTITVAIPDREEQDSFVRILDPVEVKEFHHQRKHAALASLFRTLLHQLMTAQIRVHDLDLDEILSQPARGKECHKELGIRNYELGMGD
jgi:type I restriction enzyme, S subunit